ncbi:cobalt transporter CbiM [Tropicimonas isoalkanivorans]|uniref:Cobalt/nickel transport system permease protein n=1 Tax=Tropicimonas isoalkanivorans TaxID=441112 RepID=A0A1I1LDD5_9RHOB|nr:cobalt transporter CbiM [Tropicimonas isoalkanivorans]SFC71084.1 cobalt/nickel transport system permease protein [Tropicimonas isoalkanivorans]
MHIVDGALSNPVVIGGAVLAAGGIAKGLRCLPMEKIPVAGTLSATFFVASLVHVPAGPSSLHLILNGLAGLVLGWAAFPALFVGLLLQAVFFGFGGVTVLGVNTFNIAMPAVIVGCLLRSRLQSGTPEAAAVWGAVGGGLAVALTTFFVALALALTGEQFYNAAKLVFLTHIPVMAIEAFLTGSAIYLTRKVKPELFEAVAGAGS